MIEEELIKIGTSQTEIYGAFGSVLLVMSGGWYLTFRAWLAERAERRIEREHSKHIAQAVNDDRKLQSETIAALTVAIDADAKTTERHTAEIAKLRDDIARVERMVIGGGNVNH